MKKVLESTSGWELVRVQSESRRGPRGLFLDLGDTAYRVIKVNKDIDLNTMEVKSQTMVNGTVIAGGYATGPSTGWHIVILAIVPGGKTFWLDAHHVADNHRHLDELTYLPLDVDLNR